MTPYVFFQEELIRWLFELCERNPEHLRLLAERCRHPGGYLLGEYLLDMGFDLGRYEWFPTSNLHEVILEQIDDSGDAVVIRNLLGSPLYTYQPYALEGWVEKRGRGENALRTNAYAQPGALSVGDVLITGERVLWPPREGGNGAVLVHLSGRTRGTWLSFPSRTALALIGAHDGPIPPGLIEE